jgi:penicillin-binding protein 1A
VVTRDVRVGGWQRSPPAPFGAQANGRSALLRSDAVFRYGRPRMSKSRPAGRGPSKKSSSEKRTGARAGARKKPASRAVQLALVAVAAIGFLAASAAFVLAGTLWYFSRGLPSAESLRHYAPPQTTRIVDRHGVLLGELFTERRTVVAMSRIPRVLVLSVLAAEDADFYHHSGMDVPGMARVLYKAVVHGRATQGGSTITQQVVKNLLLTPERTLERKVKELILARRIEQELTKDEILFLYLSHINFGHGRYGVEEASRFYFGKSVEKLDLGEASMLAGIPQSPARLSPRTHPEAARRRQLFVLDQLEKKRELYWSDLPAAELALAKEKPPAISALDDVTGRAPELMPLVQKALTESVGAEQLKQGGFTVITSLDLALQDRARTIVREGLVQVDQRHGRLAPFDGPKLPAKALAQLARDTRPDHPHRAELHVSGTYDAVVTGADGNDALFVSIDGVLGRARLASLARFNPKQLGAAAFASVGTRVRATVRDLAQPGPVPVDLPFGPEGAAMIVDARSREVLAMVGGYDAGPGFNRATQALRQPGSTYKAIVYAEAIRSRKLTPASLVIDAPGAYDKYKPSNYETWGYEGAVRLRHGLAQSINSVAVRTIDQIGPDSVVELSRALGITTPLDPSLSLALGASEVRMSELTNAYTTFAAGGRFAPLKFIRKIIDRGGKTLRAAGTDDPRDVLTPAEAYVMTSLLGSVISDGTAQKAKSLGRPAAGKTGTSNQARDAWFVGYTPTLVASVWVGFDDHRPLGTKESGGKAALPIWIELMKSAHADAPPEGFVVPPGVSTARIDPQSGLLAYEGEEDAIDEVFLDGTVPTETARPPDVADPTTFMMEQLGEAAGL